MNSDTDNADDQDALKALTVLYVEDEADTREELTLFLRRRVAQVHTAANGQAGLEVFVQHRPDLVITDIRMPEMDGLAMVEQIRAINPKTPIILTTAFEESRYFQRAIDLGVDKYVTKPVKLDLLVAALQKCAHNLHLEATLRASEAFTLSVLNSLTEQVAVLDAQGVIVYVNAAWQRFAEDNSAPALARQSVGLSYRNICLAAAGQPHGEEALFAWAGIEVVLIGARDQFTLEYPCNSPEESRWFRMNVYPLVAPGSGVIVAHENITERKQVEVALNQTKRALEEAQRLAKVGSWDWVIATDTVTWSKELYRILDCDPAHPALTYQQHPQLYTADSMTRLEAAVTQAIAYGMPYEVDLERIQPDGSSQWIIGRGEPQYDAQHRIVGLRGTCMDITERHRLEEALRELAIRDPLTGLFNRRYLDETLPRELHRCQRNGEPLAVAMLDIDHFKHCNDAYGHEAGDAVLRAMGDLLKGFFRAGDIACRYGGEELTVILPGSTLDNAQIRLNDLRRAIMQLRVLYKEDELPTITVSMGVAAAGEQEVDAAALLGRADAALYQAKAQGRNRVVVAS